MDVFALREGVVDDYKRYIESFVRIRDKRIDEFVREQFDSGALWPDPILQLNPAYEPGPTLDDLAAKGIILPGTAQFFRKHGRRATPALPTPAGSHRDCPPGRAVCGHHGHRLRQEPHLSCPHLRPHPAHQSRKASGERHHRLSDERADQQPTQGASRLREESRAVRWSGSSATRAKKNRTSGDEILDDPPHILLTNYVMLEYMLLRPAERHLTEGDGAP